MSAEMVLPGDEVAAGEEFMAGTGTYEREGRIFAAVAGVKRIMDREMTVCVQPFKRARELGVGDVVVGEATSVSRILMNVSLSLSEIGGKWERTGGDGALHVSKASKDYDEDLGRLFRTGDIVRAKVLQVSPSLQLSTEGAEEGVLLARCSRCRSVMSRNGRDLWCARCERSERRRLAPDYDEFAPLDESNMK